MREIEHRVSFFGMESAADVIVVGAGHNGLVAACYLAKAGFSVCVLERYHEVGGAAFTQERRGDEVHRGLAPPGALHAQHASALVHEIAHGVQLVLAEDRARPGQIAQELGGPAFEGGGVG